MLIAAAALMTAGLPAVAQAAGPTRAEAKVGAHLQKAQTAAKRVTRLTRRGDSAAAAKALKSTRREATGIIDGVLGGLLNGLLGGGGGLLGGGSTTTPAASGGLMSGLISFPLGLANGILGSLTGLLGAPLPGR